MRLFEWICFPGMGIIKAINMTFSVGNSLIQRKLQEVLKMFFRTLLLEDDENMRRLLELMLKRRGHQVASYDSPLHCPLFGESSCGCDGEAPCIDFLITDNRMPGMSGMEFIQQQAQRSRQFKEQHKAIMSACWREQDKQLAIQLGFEVFRKPFNWNEFLAWLAIGEERISAAYH